MKNILKKVKYKKTIVVKNKKKMKMEILMMKTLILVRQNWTTLKAEPGISCLITMS